MTGRHLRTLVGLLVVLLIAGYGFWKREQPEPMRPSPLANAKPESIARIDIASAGKPAITLVQKDGRWRLTAPVEDACDAATLEPLVGGLKDFTYGSVVSDSPDRLARYEVSTASATRLTVRLAGSAAPALDLLVGKPTADYGGSFVRAPDSNAVRTADGLSAFLLRMDASRLRDARVVPFPLVSMDKLSATWKGGKATVVKSSATWTSASRKAVPETTVAALRESLAGLRASNFDSAPLGTTEGEFTVSAGTVSVHAVVAAAGKNDAGRRRLTVEGRPGVFLVPDAAVKSLFSALKSIR